MDREKFRTDNVRPKWWKELHHVMDKVLRSVGGQDVFVGGFSQGGMLSIDVAMNCAVRGAFSINGLALRLF